METIEPKDGDTFINIQPESELKKIEILGAEMITIKGKDGIDGINGINGTNGEDGNDGRNGSNGIDGINGKDGEDGMDGKDGSPDTPEQIAEKINTLDKVIDFKVLKNIPSTDEMVKELKGKLDISDIKNGLWNQPGKGKLDQRWHGGGLTKVYHDNTLTGDGSPDVPLSVDQTVVVGDHKVLTCTGDTQPGYLFDKILGATGINIGTDPGGSGSPQGLTIGVNEAADFDWSGHHIFDQQIQTSGGIITGGNIIPNGDNTQCVGNIGCAFNCAVITTIFTHQIGDSNGSGQFYFDGSMEMQVDIQMNNFGFAGSSYINSNGDISGQCINGSNINGSNGYFSSGFCLANGAVNGYVLTSDGSGNGTWQPAGGGGTENLCVVLFNGNSGGNQDITNVNDININHTLTAGCDINASNSMSAPYFYGGQSVCGICSSGYGIWSGCDIWACSTYWSQGQQGCTTSGSFTNFTFVGGLLISAS